MTDINVLPQKIKVQIKRRNTPSPSQLLPTLDELSDPSQLLDNIGIRGLMSLCRYHKVIVRGDEQSMCNILKKKLYRIRYKETNSIQIVGRFFIKYLFWKLGACHLINSVNNTEDFYTSTSISVIPVCYQFFTDSDQVHGYDIRSLVFYRNNSPSDFRNPYTNQPFTNDEIRRLETKIKWLDRFGYNTCHIMDQAPCLGRGQSQSQSHGNKWTVNDIQQYTVNVFSYINEHQYIDYRWFVDLSFSSLKSLYHELFEIWNYRLPMQTEHKEKMVHGTIFSNYDNVKQYQPSMANKLRVELLKNIEKLVTEGETEDHRKNGCYIFMLGLVLVSEDAATSYPNMFHAAYYDEDE